jgi:hypothetical protein
VIVSLSSLGDSIGHGVCSSSLPVEELVVRGREVDSSCFDALHEIG